MARLRRRNVVTKSARGWSGSATWTETALGLREHGGHDGEDEREGDERFLRVLHTILHYKLNKVPSTRKKIRSEYCLTNWVRLSRYYAIENI